MNINLILYGKAKVSLITWWNFFHAVLIRKRNEILWDNQHLVHDASRDIIAERLLKKFIIILVCRRIQIIVHDFK